MASEAIQWLDQTTLQGILSQQTNILFLYTLEITHAEIDTIRIVNDTEQLIRNSQTYLPFPFTATTPAQTSSTPPVLEINVDVVDQRIMQAMRELKGLREAPEITIERVVKHNPDDALYSGTFTFKDMTTDGATTAKIKADLLPGSLNNAYPRQRFTPSNAK